jgi:hypothetical protein
MLGQNASSNNAFQLLSRVTMEDGNGLLVPGPEREQIHEATECMLSMCVVQHKLSVEQGITFHSEVLPNKQPFLTHLVLENKFLGTYVYDVEPATVDGVNYTVEGYWTLSALANSIEMTLSGNVTAQYLNSTISGKNTFDGDVVPSSDLSSFFYAGLDFNDSITNIATSVSSYMRSLSQETVTGEAQSEDTYIHVKWAWIAFPMTLVFGGALLLVLAIIQTRRKGVEVWKYSCLPLLFHSVGNEIGGGEVERMGDIVKGPMNTVEEMEEESRRIHVRLGKGGKGGAWMLQPDPRGYIQPGIR